MPIAIRCPGCNQKHIVTDKHIGRTVVCLNEACGESFTAENVEDRQQFARLDTELFVSDADLIPQTDQDPRPWKQPKPAPVVDANGNVVPLKELCQFAILGRMLVYPGLILLLAGMACPCTVYQSSSGVGLASFERGSFFNMPLAMTKLSAVLAGMTFCVTGAALWAGSKHKPLKEDIIFVSVVLVGAAIWTIFSLGPAFK